MLRRRRSRLMFQSPEKGRSRHVANWSNEEKQVLLWQSPWAREGFARIEDRKQPTVGYVSNGKQGVQMPDTRPGVPPGGMTSVPIGEPIPPVPTTGGEPVR